MNANNATQWVRVAALFVAGCATAFHIGKVPVALPGMSAELDLTLLGASWVVSLFSVLVGLSGILVGLSAGRLGYRNAAILGLVVASVASVAGAQAATMPLLLLSRAFEGLGWIFAAVSIPVLIVSVSNEADRSLVLGLWGAFLPAGVASAMLVAPALIGWAGWRGLWVLAGAVSALGALLVALSGSGNTARPVHGLSLQVALALVLRKAPLLAFGCFLVYSAQFLAVTSFLPTLLLQKTSISIRDAALLAALVVLSNVVGNIVSGYLLGKGVSRFRILQVALTSMLVLSVCVFVDQVSLPIRIAAAAGFTAVGGLIPGTLFATAPLLVRDMTHTGVINGLLLQAAGTGQMLGPIVLAGLVEVSHSWAAAIVFTVASCSAGLVCVYLLQREWQPVTPDNETRNN